MNHIDHMMIDNKKIKPSSFPVSRYYLGPKHELEVPNLNEIQSNSYKKFLQHNIGEGSRENIGMQEVLSSVFPVTSASENISLEFISYSLKDPKYDVDESKHRGISYSSSVHIFLRLILWENNEITGKKDIKNIKEQSVYMGEIPLMTPNGTFIINGTERVIVSQVHRSPGVSFDHDDGKSHVSGKLLFFARIIPNRGAWLDLEFDAKGLLFFRIDRKKKLPVSSLLYSMGYSKHEIYEKFYKTYEVEKIKNKWSSLFIIEKYKGIRVPYSIIDSKTGEEVISANTKITNRIIKKLAETNFDYHLVDDEQLFGEFLGEDIKLDNVLYSIGTEITEELLKKFKDNNINKFKLLLIDNSNYNVYLRNTIFADKNTSQQEANAEIFRILRSGEPANIDSVNKIFDDLFCNSARYDLSEVGRVKINARLNLNSPLSQRTLTHDDVIETIKILLKLQDGIGNIDDIDHLGNRRVRSVGELVENQFRIGVVRMAKAAAERMSIGDIDNLMPHDLISPKILGAVTKEFFGSSQLSQFMDQTNPLSEITHKRRLSALGPGGLSKERATFEVRDVHPTHYGKICPIETPEGQNIGLINSMAIFARVNKLGFLESPYMKVVDKQVTKEVVYLSAIEEEKYIIAQSNATLDKNNILVEEIVSARKNGEFVMIKAEEVQFMDVSPMQLVSVAASLIPFLESDDSSRALMGSNMQRQAVPLIRSERPLIGTGNEAIVAKDSGSPIICKRSGVVEKVDSKRIVIKILEEVEIGESNVDIYSLKKYQRSNFDTCINQKPIVKPGDYVLRDQVIADGTSTDSGDLSLGKNILVAFLPWDGYNFEDSIIISQKLSEEDIFTSIHIEEFEIIARDTRLGPEEITRDIPSVGEEGLKHIDEAGIVQIGAEVKSGDILVGKVTPKSESPMTPEEKLLRAIFGEKAADVKDSSLHVPQGISGTVIEVRVFSRRGVEKDQRALSIEYKEILNLNKDKEDELSIIEASIKEQLLSWLVDQTYLGGLKSTKVPKTLTDNFLKDLDLSQLLTISIDNSQIMKNITIVKERYNNFKINLNSYFSKKIEKLHGGDDMPQGALKIVKVFIASKHKLQPGDKLAGRHGNKGIVSKIVPIQDMPFLEDGTPIDMILNPLGIPSRMNIGQIWEVHLGWVAYNIGRKVAKALDQFKLDSDIEKLRSLLIEIYEKQDFVQELVDANQRQIIESAIKLTKGMPFASPVFEGGKQEDIERLMRLYCDDTSGQVTLYDGRTGEKLERKVTVGVKYMLKLHHMVDDKIHARSVGPYSLVTQQPLGGKSHNGGQRFGEMECWALQAYGAAYTLQEMLTVKSDDVHGRVKMYSSIVKGDCNFESGIPESFNVMVKELQSLGLNIDLEEYDTAMIEDKEDLDELAILSELSE